MKRALTRQRGAALVTAIFLLVALAALGAYMLTLSGVSQAAADHALLGTRVYSGAKGGLEWGIHRAVNNDTTMCGATPVTTTLSPLAMLEGVSVTVACTVKVNQVGAKYVRTYYLVGTATYGSPGTRDYVERKIEATVCRSDSPGGSKC